MERVFRAIALFGFALVVAPGVAQAQVSVLGGVGITTPLGSLADEAESGYHATVGLEVGVPSIPVSLRLDGAYHRLSAASDEFDGGSVLGGGLDVIFALPGVGLEPYALVGIGRYRVDGGPVDGGEKFSARGFATGFGVNLGSLAFAELRYVRVRGRTSGTGNTTMLPLSVGFRM